MHGHAHGGLSVSTQAPYPNAREQRKRFVRIVGSDSESHETATPDGAPNRRGLVLSRSQRARA